MILETSTTKVVQFQIHHVNTHNQNENEELPMSFVSKETSHESPFASKNFRGRLESRNSRENVQV
jgi:hypothetical protein